MEANKPIENVLENTLKNMKSMVDIDCIVGKPISQDGCCIIPISKVTVGFISGGGEYNTPKKKVTYPFAGGSGGGCNIVPIGFLVVTGDKVQVIKVETDSNVDKIVDIIKDVVSKVK